MLVKTFNVGGPNNLDQRIIFSDFVRLEILDSEGGFWIDPSMMLLDISPG
jgi:hypothetical protein